MQVVRRTISCRTELEDQKTFDAGFYYEGIDRKGAVGGWDIFFVVFSNVCVIYEIVGVTLFSSLLFTAYIYYVFGSENVWTSVNLGY